MCIPDMQENSKQPSAIERFRENVVVCCKCKCTINTGCFQKDEVVFGVRKGIPEDFALVAHQHFWRLWYVDIKTKLEQVLL